jgi:4-amino-4-deoxy-L-arabinose transferase-like glycosyltransferase
MDSEGVIEKRKQKILKWIKQNDNYIFLGIILIAFIVRIYFFILTKNQPLWWDEAEYMLKGKSIFLGTPSTGWALQREIIVPFLWGIFYYISRSEIIPRLLQILVSLFVIGGTYLIGKEIYSKKVGLIASLIIAVNAVYLFFTMRLLVYPWAPLFYILIFYFFWKGYVKKENVKYFYLSAIFAAIGISIYGSVAFAVLILLAFFIITEQYKFLFKKEIWIATLIGLIFLIPQFIYNYVSYGNLLSRWTAFSKTASASVANPSALLSYFKMFPHLFGNLFSIFILLGFLYILIIILLSFDLIIKNKKESIKAKSHLFIILWILTVIGFYTYAAYSGEAVYDAFIFPSFPALAIMASIGFLIIYKIPVKKQILTILLVLLLIMGCYYQISYANTLIKNKKESFDHVREAGLWIKENTEKGDIIISKSRPQNTYYSERETIAPANSTENMLKQLKDIKPKYLINSIFEPTSAHVYEFPEKYPELLSPARAYTLNDQQASLIIYSVNISNLD